MGRHQVLASTLSSGSGRVLNRLGTPAAEMEDLDFALFWDVWNRLKEGYYQQPVSDKILFYGALHGLVSSLGDPYTVFFDPQEAEEFHADFCAFRNR